MGLVLRKLIDIPVNTHLHFLLDLIEHLKLNKLGEWAELLLVMKGDEVIAKAAHFGISMENQFFFKFPVILFKNCFLSQ